MNLTIYEVLKTLTLTAVAIACLLAPKPLLAQGGEQMEEVIVNAKRATTATKTDTLIVETPQAISVIDADLFLDRGARNIQETLRYSAGVTAEAYGLDTRSENISVRGLTPVEYQDGMRRVYNYNPLPRVDVNTLERVEVLRGPSSVLYGQGANGGIVNLVSKRPAFDAGGEIGIEVGNYDRKQVRVDATGALNGDETIAGRVVALRREAGMQTDWVPDDRMVVAPSLSWQPTERTSLTFMGLYQKDETASSQQFLPVAATLNASGDRKMDLETFLGDENYDTLDAEQIIGALLFEHEFSDAVTLRSQLRYVDASTTFREIYPDVYSNPVDPFIDPENRLVNRYAYQVQPDVEIFTSDTSALFHFETGPLEHILLAGLDYTDFDQRSRSGFGTVTPIDIYDPVSTGVVAPDYFDDPDQRNTQTGIYLQDQIRYADRVSLVLGARRDRAQSETGGGPTQTDRATTYRVGLIGELIKGVSPYISYSESFLPVAGLDVYNAAFTPIRGRQYEAGIKWEPTPGTLITANAFDIEEKNRTTNDPNNVLNTVQTGKVESSGMELEAVVAVTGNFYLTAAYSYNEAEVTQSNFAPEVGAQLSDTPKHLASLWASGDYQIAEVLLQWGAGVRYVGETLSTSFSGSLETPSYTLADAMVAVIRGQWSLEVNVTNLTDKEYYAPCRAFGDCFTGNRRTVVGALNYRF